MATFPKEDQSLGIKKSGRRKNMFGKGFFGGLFDFNRDGKLNSAEQAADFGAFMSFMEDEETAEVDACGLDYDELAFMDEDERNTILEENGLDPDDYDF